MKRPAVFFDRDNTLIVSDGYLGDPAGVRLVPGAADAIARCRALGYVIVVFSNQSGVARGMFDESAVHAVNMRLDEVLAESNHAAIIDRHEFCPYHPEATVEAYRQDSDLRKPKPGMILRAAERLALDLTRSWAIGDAPRDIEAGKAAGCKAILVKDTRLTPSPAALGTLGVEPDATVTSLTEAVAFIERNTTPPPESEPIAAPVTNNHAPPAVMLPPTPVTSPAVPMEQATAPQAAGPVDLAKLEHMAEQILHELHYARDQTTTDFSVSKLLAGITQVLSLAALFLAYLRKDDWYALTSTILVAIAIQVLTISLLIMGRQK